MEGGSSDQKTKDNLEKGSMDPPAMKAPGKNSKTKTSETPHRTLSISSHNSLELRLGADGKIQAKTEWPHSPLTQESMPSSFGNDDGSSSSEDSTSHRRSWTGGSVISHVSHTSKSQLPLTDTGFFSDPDNFEHFKDCAYTYLQQGPGLGVSTETAAGLKVLFERATQLGVYSRATRTLTWSRSCGH